jgi:hypothetical protein
VSIAEYIKYGFEIGMGNNVLQLTPSTPPPP